MKNLLQRIANGIRSIFSKTFDLAEKEAPKAVIALQKLKHHLEQNGTKYQSFVEMTKNEKDNELFQILSVQVPKLANELAVIDGLADKDSSLEESFEAYFNYVMQWQKKYRGREWVFLAGQILMAILGKKIPDGLATFLTQKAYLILFGKKD
jgi:hypothetical protein